MAEILCPECGKSNPDELETCRFCQAPLKPIDDALPDWLGDLQHSEPEQPTETSSTGEVGGLEADLFGVTSDSDLPDWLRQSATPPKSEIHAPPAPASTDPTEETPDWLAALSSLPEPKALPPSKVPAQGSAVPAEKLPDWLANLGEAQNPDIPLEEPPPVPFDGVETPDWLTSLDNVPTDKPVEVVPAFTFNEEEDAELLVGGEDQPLSTLPDWASQITSEQTEVLPPEPIEPGLVPEELPGWLIAMRPVESVAPTAPLEDLSGTDVVSAGPLIGLRGVLSAEPDALKSRKPVSYSLKLHVTDDQRSRLVLMEELLASELTPKPLPAQPVLTPQNIFRLGIALALFLPVLFMMIRQSLSVPLPSMETLPGVQDFYNELVDVAPETPVLLAIDYEAGFTGEMEVGARAVVEQLARQQAFLVLMSTNTTGPALAERLLTEIAIAPGKPYPNAVNLGYLPGGALGLAELVLSPRQSLPYTLNAIDPWVLPSLTSINTLSDFSLVIVMTNDAETARAWIEQTSPALQANGVSLLLVTSSQAEPLVIPYTSGALPQVQGLLAGLPGSVLLEHRTGVASNGSGMWDAFSLSLTISALVILIGSVSGAVIAALKEGKPETKKQPGRKSEPKQEQS